MRVILNFLWFIFGGAVMGLCWWFYGCLAFISIVGIPWGRACFVIGNFTFFPFGKEAISRKELYGKDDIGTGGWGLAGNVIWFIFAGFWLPSLNLNPITRTGQVQTSINYNLKGRFAWPSPTTSWPYCFLSP